MLKPSPARQNNPPRMHLPHSIMPLTKLPVSRVLVACPHGQEAAEERVTATGAKGWEETWLLSSHNTLSGCANASR